MSGCTHHVGPNPCPVCAAEAREAAKPKRIGYLDPPYIGMAKLKYGNHPDYAGEVDHRQLLADTAQYDGWILHCSVPSLPEILGYATDLGLEYRICAWMKTWATFRRNVPVAYAWEPILVHEARKPVVDPTRDVVMRDWYACRMAMQKGLIGAKPAELCQWLFCVVGAEPTDELVDVFPGSGSVTQAWRDWTGDYTAPATLFEEIS